MNKKDDLKLIKCQFCGKLYNKYGIGLHIWRAHGEGKDFDPNKGYKDGTRKAWNKGLTKETDQRVRKQGQTYGKNLKTGVTTNKWLGRKLTDEHKANISKGIKKWLKNNSNFKPFGGQRREMSSYQHWFLQKVINSHKLYQQFDIVNQYYQCPYFLDFAFINVKLDVQIDGRFHQEEQMQLSDKKRTEQLEATGWKVYRIDYKQINDNQEKVIFDFLSFLKNLYKTEKTMQCKVFLQREYKKKKRRTWQQYCIYRKQKAELRLKQKRKNMNPNLSGKNSSQYGTMWITNGINNKKIKKDQSIPDGWYKGRKINV